MRTPTAVDQGVQIAYHRFGSSDNPLLLIMALPCWPNYPTFTSCLGKIYELPGQAQHGTTAGTA
ncbi:MAG TPA: hypothetical protein VGF65_10450 [Mycobacterium sp.]|jgi:hypothetical protein